MNIPYYQDYQEFFQRQNFEILPKNSVDCNGTMRKSMEIFLPFLRATYFLIFLTTYDFENFVSRISPALLEIKFSKLISLEIYYKKGET